MDNYEELKSKSLYYLRNIAREIGVKSPTSLTKEKLIVEIMNIHNGEALPSFTTRGRPAIKNEPVQEEPKKVSIDKEKCIEEILEQCKKDILRVLSED